MQPLLKILDYILENYPVIGVLLLVILITVLATVAIHKHVHKLNETSRKVDSLPCDSHDKNISDVNTKIIENISSTRRLIENLRDITLSKHEAIEELCTWVMKKDRSMIDVLRKGSPLAMTSVGKQIFEMMPAKKTVDDNLDYLIEEIEKGIPLTAFDVEDLSLKIMLRNISHSMFNNLKNYLYDSPEEVPMTDSETNEQIQVKISMSMAIQLMGIYLRDKYLESHPDLNT